MTAASPSTAICEVERVRHHYGDRVALDGIDLRIDRPGITSLLGPNGSGKTTLFRLLSTLVPVQQGSIRINGHDTREDPLSVRREIGIVFQSPSLDPKLTVDENIACQAALYGLAGSSLSNRRDQLLEQFQLTERRSDYCESLSGGLKRRVEIAKSLLHRPSLMLLDEPSAGLDPSARATMWEGLVELAEQGTAVLLTTHLMDEAERSGHVVILDGGRKVAEGDPHGLRSGLGGQVLEIEVRDIAETMNALKSEWQLSPQRVGDTIRVGGDVQATQIATIADRLGDSLRSITLSRPTLKDVFVAKTGRAFTGADQ